MNRSIAILAAPAVAVLAISLSGCVGSAVRTGIDMNDRSSNLSLAEAGDAKAQYQVGKSWCCALGGWDIPVADQVYDTETASEFLCRAALQNFGPAQLELARLYSGRVTHSLMPILVRAVAPPPTDMAAALMWADLASTNKVDGAEDLRRSLAGEASPEARAEAARRSTEWQSAPCTWRDTIGGQTASDRTAMKTPAS